MQIQGQVGPSPVFTTDGNLIPPRFGKSGDQIVQELHGRYYETTYRKNLFTAANPSAVTTTVGLANTYVGICLSNPIGSMVNLVLNKVGYSFTVAFPAPAAIGLMGGANVGNNIIHTTPLTPQCTFLGGNAPVGKVDSSAGGLGQTNLLSIISEGDTAAVGAVAQGVAGIIDMEGSVIVPPNYWIAVYTSTASGASGFQGSLQWEEIPL